ncbi:lactonase family protein [Vibrio ordalii]|uniref:lactonase family protein n=1 Tax=Vibrio ordalii TaxID=28174 RepID=UPI0002E73300|nr:lactonase family protein [Vibrio ordalii]OEE73138.1 6-phosphogluconolactonase [Vibrio ordalii FF-167]
MSTHTAARFYIGTYTDAPSSSNGVELIELNTITGELSVLQEVMATRNPSYLLETTKGFYTFNEVEASDNPQLIHINKGSVSQVPLSGSYACNLAIDAKQRYCAVAHYGSGNVNIVRLDDTGKPELCIADLWINGQGPNAERQTSPHAHQVVFLKQSSQLVVVDLGSDAIHFFAINSDNQAFSLAQTVEMPAGSGPRHVVFNHAETRAFVVCELSETLVTLVFSGTQWQIETECDLLPNEAKSGAAAAIKLSPDERFLYASCREQNKIVLFELCQPQPQWIAAFDVGGQFPRDFTLSADGDWLLVASQHSNTITSYRRDETTGRLVASGFSCKVGAPVCVIEQHCCELSLL